MNKVIRNLVIFLILVTCSGCGILADAVRVGYERSNEVAEGRVIRNKKGLFAVKVPESYLYAQSNRHALELVGQNSFGIKYAVFTQHVDKLPEEIVNNLEATRKWLVNDFIKSKAKDIPQVLYEETKVFKNQNSLYFESFFSAIVTKTKWGTRIDRNAIGYSNIVFYYKDYLYWLYCSETFGFGEGVRPDVQDKTRDKFDTFLSGFSLQAIE